MRHSMKHKNITLSFPIDLSNLLHKRVSNRGISKYVSDVVRKALEEDEKNEFSKLEAAYKEASQERKKNQEMKDWENLDNLDETEGWEWNNE